jgi:hypothetical protein
MDEEIDPEMWVGTYVLDEQGDPQMEQDILTWAQWYSTADTQVALSEFAWGRVSTIFLGIDMSNLPVAHSSTYRPILWETMVFLCCEEEAPADLKARNPRLQAEKFKQQRYRSRKDALEGHRQMVEECLAAVDHAVDRIPITSA